MLRAMCGGWHRAEVAGWQYDRLLQAVQAELRLAMGWQIPEADAGGVVFPATGGGVMDHSSSREIWAAAEGAAGVPVTRQDTVRHAISTNNALAKVNPHVTAAVLGHSAKIEMDVYVKLGMEVADEFTALESSWREQLKSSSGGS